MSRRDQDAVTIVFAGGGSGGHLAPGIAVAEALTAAGPAAQARFLCSQRPIDAEILGRAGVEFTPLPARPGRSPRSVLAFFGAVRRARAHLRDWDARAVLSLGGFVSLPVAVAAWRLGIPILLLNLDAVAGRANRVVARLATRVLSAVPPRNLRVAEGGIVGMPVRRAARADGDAPACRRRLGLDPDRPTLLVTGASQGSASFNDAVPAIIASSPQLFRSWQVLHLAGAGDEARIRAIESRYRAAGVAASVIPFLHEMGDAWGAATLAITRGGASSVAEASANAVPSIFVPFPHHHDQHQRSNAMPLVERGAARLARDPVLAEGVDPPLDEVLRATAGDSSFMASAREILLRAMPRHPAERVAEELRALASRRNER